MRADSAALRTEKIYLALASEAATRKEVTLDDRPIKPEHFTVDVHRRAWQALCATKDKPLDISSIHSDSELVGLVAELTAISEREFLHLQANRFQAVLEELELRLESRRLGRAIAALKEELATAETDRERQTELARLKSLRHAVQTQLRTAALEE